MNKRKVLELNIKDRKSWSFESKYVVFRCHFIPSEEIFSSTLCHFDNPTLTHFEEIFYEKNKMLNGEWVKKIIAEKNTRYQLQTVVERSPLFISFEEQEAVTLKELGIGGTVEEVARFYVSRLEYKHKTSDTVMQVDWTEFTDGDIHVVVSLSSSSLHELSSLLDSLHPKPIRSKISEYLYRYCRELYEQLVEAGKLNHVEEDFMSFLSSLFDDNHHPQSIASGVATKEQRAKTNARYQMMYQPNTQFREVVLSNAEIEEMEAKADAMEWLE